MKNILILIAVVAVVGAGVLYYRSSHAPVAPSPSAEASASPSSSPSTSPTQSKAPSSNKTPTPTPGILFRESTVYQVSVEDSGFTPSPLPVIRGDVIVFTNLGKETHTITALNKKFDSKNILPNAQWTLETGNLAPGTYEYQCTLHPSLHGTIVVQ